ncbi:MAG: cytidylate kinase-like family protein [Candidatus Nealsonbacteria bacterium]|nr:cytidylate kinase-like family protein [Candidatus Nealsonbacteria bacterium]
MKEQTREEPKIVAAAERQMQAWVKTAEIQEQTIRDQGAQNVCDQIGKFLTISREEGAGGSEIAQLVGEKLGWEVLDKNLLDRVGERLQCSRAMLELVDETPGNWVLDVLGGWMDKQIVSQEKYVVHLGRVVLAAARRGNVVLVGRGAQFLLPREKGLCVRIIAPKKFRAERIAAGRNLDAAAARKLVDETDLGRREFAQRFFHHEIDDPHHYDLVINAERIGPDDAADTIAQALARVSV